MSSRSVREAGARQARTSGEVTLVSSHEARQALAELRHLESRIGVIARVSRVLPAITADNGAAERARLCAALERGEVPVPAFRYPALAPHGVPLRMLDTLRRLAERTVAPVLYLQKLDELELDLALLSSLGEPRLLRPLAARRFGTGNEEVDTPDGRVTLSSHARRLVAVRLSRSEPKTLPADAPDDSPSLARMVRGAALAVGLDVEVRVEPNLTAGAATGDRTVFLADRRFGEREALRLTVHEVLGHLTSAANARTQPLRLLEWGTAGSFEDQEGLSLFFEAEHGVLDRARMRTLGARVLATDLMHHGASFGETARELHRGHGFSAEEAIALAERAYRGGGVARDVAYLRGYLRVRSALAEGHALLGELRMGRVSVEALPELRSLARLGLVRPAVYLRNLSRSFCSTSSGTMPCKSPPSAAASLINVELTK